MPTITAPLIDADLWPNGLDEKVSPVTRLALHDATRQDLAGLAKTLAGIGEERTYLQRTLPLIPAQVMLPTAVGMGGGME